MNYLLIALLWTGYCALHSFLISIWFTNLMMSLLKDYYSFYRLFYVVISFVLLVPLINYSVQTDSVVIITYTLPLTIVRYLLILISVLIFLWSFFLDYDFLSFFGIRQIVEFRKDKTLQSSKEIRKKGLLGIIRHPMYLALLIYLWCQTFRLADVVVNVVLTAYIIIGTQLEEQKLVLEFGDTYTKYQHEVPMLIPFTKAKG